MVHFITCFFQFNSCILPISAKECENNIMSTNNPFAGKAVVATGKLVNYTHDGIRTKLLELGAKPGSSVSKKTDSLIVGEKASSKLAKAQQLGVTTYEGSDTPTDLGKISFLYLRDGIMRPTPAEAQTKRLYFLISCH